MTIGQAPRLRRLCLVVDIEAYSGRPYSVQQRVQVKLDRVLEHACLRAGVARSRCERQDRGDGQLLLFPSGADEAEVLPGLVLGLRDALYTLNRNPGTDGRLRIRAALTQGAVQRSPLGYVGRSVELACRLVDSAKVREALTAAQESDLVLVVAADLFEDAFAPGTGGLPGADFTRVTVSIPAKRFMADAWVGTPERGVLVSLPSAERTAAKRRQTTREVMTGVVGTIGVGRYLANPSIGAALAAPATNQPADPAAHQPAHEPTTAPSAHGPAQPPVDGRPEEHRHQAAGHEDVGHDAWDWDDHYDRRDRHAQHDPHDPYDSGPGSGYGEVRDEMHRFVEEEYLVTHETVHEDPFYPAQDPHPGDTFEPLFEPHSEVYSDVTVETVELHMDPPFDAPFDGF